MTDWFKVYQWIKYPIIFGFSIFMLVVFLDGRFYNFIHTNLTMAEGMAEILFAIIMGILFSSSLSFFISKIISRREQQKEMSG